MTEPTTTETEQVEADRDDTAGGANAAEVEAREASDADTTDGE